MRDSDALRILERQIVRLEQQNRELVEHILHLTGKPRERSEADIARFEERERLVNDLADADQELSA